MAFFLFSYQVHEKSILFPLMALSLITNEYPEFMLYFTGIACFSLAPLLAKDGLLLAYGSLLTQTCLLIHKTHLEGIAERRWNRFYLLRIMMFLSLISACLLHLAETFISPPAKYPELFVLLNYAFSFGHFVLFYIYGHVVQWRYTGEASHADYTDNQYKIKMKAT
ncbi:probable dolichyl pyrophosphate Man9GlcNAc2 alpha-1,3-glucosyltransferase [Varroa destructor]|uniref:Alpha-1,3-glucosyltransferase n=2 Tax=Varroa TaxID=62624 RepID=A0A7M7K000_VARDE|nr:probable dolichyl pyrophosphate Man9GlcNAc2 alpha-1,3-glucosyltransferase [Varroa destructor]